jgi:G3E family GTPase
VRGDLVQTISDLSARRAGGEIGAYRRILIETTGLADPAPILHTLMVDPRVIPAHQLACVVTTVDAVNGGATLDSHAEALKQAAVADRIFLTKCDIADADRIALLRLRLRDLNPIAPIIFVENGQTDPDAILGAGWYDTFGKSAEVGHWLRGEGDSHRQNDHHAHRHDLRIQAHCLMLDAPVRWGDFSYWLDLLAAMRGEEMLRVKGIVAIAEEPDRPVIIHGVQHVFHPPVRLAAWPSADRRSRLVFITRDLSADLLISTLRKFAGVENAILEATP